MHHDKISPRPEGVEAAGERRTGVTGEKEAGPGALGAGETAMGRGGRPRAIAGTSWTVGDELLFKKGFREIGTRVEWDVQKKKENRVASVDGFRSL
jgi:hypothetical protein